MKAFDLILARLVIVLVFGASVISGLASTNVVVWDAMKAPAHPRVVPSNLMELEKDPLKSASDPGYYGRDYVFVGDVYVKTPGLLAYISKADGRVYLHRFKDGSFKDVGAEAVEDLKEAPEQLERFFPFKPMRYGEIFVDATGPVSNFELIRNTADEVVLRVEYGKGDAVTYTFGDNEIVEVKPEGSIKKVGFKGSVEYAIAPGFPGDDLIFKPEEAERISIPTENMLVGLLSGEGRAAVITWAGKANVTATKRGDYFGTMEIETAGEPVFIAALA